jgi:UDP-2,3-diacylglucosamine pyrophosphatase LpxH
MKTKKNKAEAEKKHTYRAVWISDVHLGTAGCKAEALAAFLKNTDCERLYLVGDIIDGWKLKSEFYWPQAHSNVIRRILTKAKRGTQVYYVVGNHDEFLRKFLGFDLQMGNIRLVNECTHTTADGRRLLVTHGDQFDVITRYHRWLALAGDTVYHMTMDASRWINRVRARAGLDYWSLADFAKRHVKTAVNIVSDYEASLARECRSRRFNGIVCGHIHHAEIRDMHGITYYNCGDWVESCTALAEDQEGRIRLLHPSSRQDVPQPATVADSVEQQTALAGAA